MGLDLRRRTTLPEWQARLRDAADREPDRFGATASFEALVRWFAQPEARGERARPNDGSR